MPPLEPRLLDVPALASYLGGMSPDTVRDLDARGGAGLVRVHIPGPGGEPLRKVLFDGLAEGRRKPLPGARVVPITPPGDGA